MQGTAFLFDIDGVFLKDGHPIPRAAEALSLLDPVNGGVPVPRVFVSNGIGVPSKVKAEHMSKTLDTRVTADDVIMAHTPMADLAEAYRGRRVLLVGRDLAPIAASIGLGEYVTEDQFAARRPFLFPQKDYSNVAIEEDATPEAPLAAVMVPDVPADWGEALQVIIDVLRTPEGRVPLDYAHSGGSGNVQMLPLHVANPDFVYAGKFAVTRQTMGAFVDCLRVLWQRETGTELKVDWYGKPHAITYAYAQKYLAKRLVGQKLTRIIAVGDNLDSDIKGALEMGKKATGVQWVPIAVQTGCFRGTQDDVPKEVVVVPDVLDAVKWALAHQ
eukprot:m51a1_g9027 hypothetical protein (329) ;mRNA; f:215571-216826